ncbi:MAG: alkaline phosphatase family protein [Holophagales bacterium]|nr:alkaline phosphatase family protein [Holophagales bacterium]
MKRFRLSTLALGASLVVSFLALAQAARREAAAPPVRSPKLAVLVSVDGLQMKRLLDYRPYFVAGLKRLLDEGHVERNAHYAHLNTETGPGHASLGTGAPPRVTGIVANRWFEPRPDGSLRPVYCTDQEFVDPETKAVGFRPGPGSLRVPTLGDRLLERYPGARVVALSGKDRGAIFMAGKRREHAVYWWDQDTGRFVSSAAYDATSPGGSVVAKVVSRFNRTRAGGHLPRRLGLAWRKMADPLFPSGVPAPATRPVPAFEIRPFQIPVNGLGWDKDMSLASNGYFHGIYYSPFIDELTVDLALEVLASKDLELGHEEQPDVLCLSLSGQDTVSHAYGPESEENLDTLRRLDVQLGRLFEALDRGFPEGKVVLALSADHGFQTIPELEARRDKSFSGGRVLSGNGAVTNFEERLNRYLCQELCLPLDAKPIFGNEGFDLKYNLPSLPAMRTLAGPCGAAGRSVTRDDIDRVLPGAIARLNYEDFRSVLLASQRASWDPADRDVRFAMNDYDPVRSGEALLIPRRGVIVYPDARGSTHGSQYEYDTNVPLVFWGGGVKAGVSDAARTPYDFAPTVGKLLGVTLPDAIGTAIDLPR